jgi:hypothetical protein
MHLALFPSLRKIPLPVFVVLPAGSCREAANKEQLKLSKKGYFEVSMRNSPSLQVESFRV